MVVKGQEPVESGRVGPQVRTELRVAAAVTEDSHHIAFCPERHPSESVITALSGAHSCVDHDVQFAVHELRVVIEPRPGDHELVVRSRRDRQDLGQALEETLIRRVDGEQPRPVDIDGFGVVGQARVLEGRDPALRARRTGTRRAA